MTRPSPLVDAQREAGADRIPHHVAERTLEVLAFLHQHGLVASFEQMPDSRMATVEPLGVHAVELPHSSREVRADRLDEHVVVIAHQAVGEHEPAVSLGNPSQQLEEALPVDIVDEDQPPFVPARDDVVDPVCDLDPRRPRHRFTVGAGDGRNHPCGKTGTESAHLAREPGCCDSRRNMEDLTRFWFGPCLPRAGTWKT